MSWCNAYFHFIMWYIMSYSSRIILDTLHPTKMQWYRGNSLEFVQVVFEAIFEIMWTNAQIKGVAQLYHWIWMIFIEYLVSLDCVVIDHQKGGDWKCIWHPKWVLVLMMYIIKELMRFLSYEQDQKSLWWKRAINDAIFAKEMVYELQWRLFTIFYFENWV